VRQDIEGLSEQQGKIDKSLEEISESFSEARDFLINKMVQNNKWRKKYKGGKLKKIKRLYTRLKDEYDR
jgi:L-lactate utilization protein LutB